MRIRLPKEDDDLLSECKVTAFRASGSGGQHVNTTDSAVRIVHIPSGITVTSQKERSQYLNKMECLTKLRARVEKLNYVAPKRLKTKVPRSVKAKNQVKKTRHSDKKSLRSKVDY